MTTIFESLIHQLQSPDPHQRIHALQVLAMVEETRAVDDILSMYNNDPDSLVRKTAKWAGNLIWQAKQRGHSTESSLLSDAPVSTDTRIAVHDGSLDYKEQRILDSLMVVPTGREQDMQNEQALLRAEWERLNIVGKNRATNHQSAANSPIIADLELLDAGLSDAFRGFLEEQE
jgi:hypothetical protein